MTPSKIRKQAYSDAAYDHPMNRCIERIANNKRLSLICDKETYTRAYNDHQKTLTEQQKRVEEELDRFEEIANALNIEELKEAIINYLKNIDL
jgi:thymidylate kinase